MPRRPAPSRRAGRTRSSHEKSDLALKMGGAALGVFAAVALLGMFIYPLTDTKPRIDRATYCPSDGPTAYIAVIVDATDSINSVQKIAIENELARIRSEVPRFGALAIYSLGAKEEVNRPEFILCNPGSARDIDWLTEGKLIAEKNWKEGYQKPLDRVLERMLSAAPDQKSPLLEAIQSVSVQSFGPLRATRNTAPKRLIIVSDMLQNSTALDVYRGIPNAAAFMSSEAYRRTRADLSDVDVEIYLIRRQTRASIQRPELMQFWQALLAAERARLVHFKPLEG